MDNQQNKNDLNLEPSELIGKHFSQSQKSQEAQETQEAQKKEIKKDPYEDLAERLSDELDGKLFETPIDFRDEQEKKQAPIDLKSTEQKNLEKKYKKELEAEKEREKTQKTQETQKTQKTQKAQKAQKAREIIGKFIKGNKKLDEKKKKIKEKKDRLKILERARKKQEKEQQKEFAKQRWPQLNFGDYINIIKKPALYLIGIEFLIYFFSLINLLKSFLLDIVLPLIIFLDIIVFIWLAVKVAKEYSYTHWIAIKTCVLIGIFVGLFSAIFKVIWINELWTLINLIVEPLLLGLIAVAAGLAVGLFVKHADI